MTDRALTPVEARVTHPSRTGSVAESERLRALLVTGRARVVDGSVEEDAEVSERVVPRRFTVYAHTTASASLTVELDEHDLVETARNLGKKVGDLTLDDLRELAADRAFDAGFPDICAQCSGWGRRGVSLDLAGDWVLDGDDDPDEDTSDAVVEVTD